MPLSQTSAEQHLPVTIKHLPTPRRGGACSEGATGALATGQGRRMWPLRPASLACRDGRGSPLQPHPWSAHSPALSIPPWGQEAALLPQGDSQPRLNTCSRSCLLSVCLPVWTTTAHSPWVPTCPRSMAEYGPWEQTSHRTGVPSVPCPPRNQHQPPPPHHLEGGSTSLAQSWSRGFLSPPRRPRPKPEAVERGRDRAGPEGGDGA